VASIDDPIVRNLVALVLARTRLRFLKVDNMSDEQWRENLPSAPFDMKFLALSLAEIFAKPDLIRRVLDGQSLAQASGWDYEA
jgi:hypothetical protein